MANRPGSARARWAWTDAAIWTEHMLDALERGVKGGRWYTLFDKMVTERALLSAFGRVKKNGGAAGVDHQNVEMFERDLTGEIGKLARQLREGTYRPQAVRRAWIPKPGSKERRPLGIPTVRDRVAQTALRQTLEPIFEKEFAEGSYGFRPGRGCKDALRRVDELLESGHTHVVDADLKAYFDTIPHGLLVKRIEEKVADGKVLSLIRAYLKAEVMDGLARYEPVQGSPQGAVVSPLLANVYLNPLDHLAASAGLEMVRYADDFVVLCRSRAEAERALEMIRAWSIEAGLTLHPDKTKLVDAHVEPFEFLGYRFFGGHRYPRQKSVQKLRDGVRALTRRTNGNSMKQLAALLNPKLRGWFEYFKLSRHTVFNSVDGFVRRRLRAVLRKRRGKAALHGSGSEQKSWPNSFFDGIGLFNMEKAHAVVAQSAAR